MAPNRTTIGRSTRRWKKIKAELRARGEAEGLPCWLCGEPIDYTISDRYHPDVFQADHIKSRKHFPHLAEDPANAAPAHRRCNISKGDSPAPTSQGLALMAQTPTVGRIVHYHSYGTPGGEYLPEARAAIITALPVKDWADEPGTVAIPNVSLAVLNPTGMFFTQGVPFAIDPTPGHWSWPPRA